MAQVGGGGSEHSDEDDIDGDNNNEHPDPTNAAAAAADEDEQIQFENKRQLLLENAVKHIDEAQSMQALVQQRDGEAKES